MRLFGRGRPRAAEPVAALPPGLRAYAIGDVHGRLDLLTDLVARIAADAAARPPAETHLVLLGDLIDRGPASAGVIALLRAGVPGFDQVHVIMGNHEEMLLRQIDDPTAEALGHFLRYGGYETLESYGTPERMLEVPEIYAPAEILAHVPPEDVAFLRGMADSVRLGDYLFVHAGIRPGVPLDRQTGAELRWIRGPFLESDADHGAVIVHGHTISEAVEMRANRIGLDTGAYASGVLTALGMEGDRRWLIATGG